MTARLGWDGGSEGVRGVLGTFMHVFQFSDTHGAFLGGCSGLQSSSSLHAFAFAFCEAKNLFFLPSFTLLLLSLVVHANRNT